MKIRTLEWITFLTFFGSALAMAAPCPQVTDVISGEARKFAISKKLIDTAAEADLDEIGMKARWRAISIRSFRGKCLVELRLATSIEGEPQASIDDTVAQVIVLTSSAGSKPKFALVEDQFKIPSSLIVAIGHAALGDDDLDGTPDTTLRNDFFFVELKGQSVVEALKSIYAGLPVPGFSGHIVKLPKPDFDLTPGRAWRVIEPEYSLTRGTTAEVGDFRPQYWDEDFEGYFKGSKHKEFVVGGKKIIGAWVGPWNAGFIRNIYIQGQCIELFTQQGKLHDPNTLPLGK